MSKNPIKEQDDFWKYNRYYFRKFLNLKYLIIIAEYIKKLTNNKNYYEIQKTNLFKRYNGRV